MQYEGKKKLEKRWIILFYFKGVNVILVSIFFLLSDFEIWIQCYLLFSQVLILNFEKKLIWEVGVYIFQYQT